MSTNTSTPTTSTFPDVPTGANGVQLLTPGEVADLFRVDPRTVTRWARTGKLPAMRTLGGHRRYRADHVHSPLANSGDDAGIAQVPA